jgi:hypothetical protein
MICRAEWKSQGAKTVWGRQDCPPLRERRDCWSYTDKWLERAARLHRIRRHWHHRRGRIRGRDDRRGGESGHRHRLQAAVRTCVSTAPLGFSERSLITERPAANDLGACIRRKIRVKAVGNGPLIIGCPWTVELGPHVTTSAADGCRSGQDETCTIFKMSLNHRETGPRANSGSGPRAGGDYRVGRKMHQDETQRLFAGFHHGKYISRTTALPCGSSSI